MLHDHEHVIDVIKWAPAEANKEIEKANYNQPEGHAHEDPEEQNNNDNNNEEAKESSELANGIDAK